MTETSPKAELPKTFDPAAIEAKWYAHWEAPDPVTGRSLFRPHRPDAAPFTIVNPPPNVTGSLHIGHALDNTLQDVVVRYERLRGKDALWVVGTDHAGIATQMVVERQLEEQQDKRTNYSREDFVAKVWEWKATSGGTITQQLRRLGCSMDWSREQFTMDPHFTHAVTKVFVDLHREGLIYRDKRLVNWDPKLKTAISDLEVETREVQGHMWHFKYPLAGGETYTYVERDADGQVVLEEQRDYIAIATTRPETMLGDGAVAVHPGDARYAPIVGKLCEIPVGPKAQRRLIPIITDEYPDPAFGSGAVKITGAHDENDYGVAQRNGIPMYRLMDEVAAMRSDGAPYAETALLAREIAAGARTATSTEIDTMNLVPDIYRGLDRYEARRRVIADIDADGLMLGVEDKVIMQPFGDRGGVVIEPMLTDQWYVNAAELAKDPIAAVRDGRIEIVPKTWEKTWFNWMENIQPWCVSRQLWWGHRIPAWYGSDGNCYVAETEEGAQAQAGAAVTLTRDEDVLDTWFSSALWPFATLGWPEAQSSPSTCDGEVDRLQGETEGSRPRRITPPSVAKATATSPSQVDGEDQSLLAKHYPNDLLISGFDILFFWCARMAMQGMHFNAGQVPWKRLYLHGLVRAADGQKMSKSKGNVVDPLLLIDQYGADALRFFMASMESQGRDVKMDERRVEGYRNFATKLWNAARFCQANGIAATKDLKAPSASNAVNKWIIGEVVDTLAALDSAMADLRFDVAAGVIYHFVWDQFCDWYIELIKGSFDAETKAVAGWVLDQILVMLHPFMPFVTEELWSKLGDRAHYPLITAKWPEPGASVDAEAKAEVEWLISVLTGVRSFRAETSIAPGLKIIIGIDQSSISEDRFEQLKTLLARHGPSLARIGKLESVVFFNTGIRIQLESGELEDRTEDRHTVPGSGAPFQAGGEEYIVGLEGLLDIASEKTRLTKALEASTKEARSLEGRLSNPAFVEKAKPEAVDKARADHAMHAAEAERLAAALARLG